MSVNMNDLKALREITGAGMTDCKNALEAAQGDQEKAIEWLRKRGVQKSERRAGNVTKEGLLGVLQGDKAVYMIRLACETDFVPRNDRFKSLIVSLLKEAALHDPDSIEQLMNTVAKDSFNITMQTLLSDQAAAFGEKLVVTDFERRSLSADDLTAIYMHNSCSMEGGVLLGSHLCVLQGKLAEDTRSDATKTAAASQALRKVAMQAVVKTPSFLKKDEHDEKFQIFYQKERQLALDSIAQDEKLRDKNDSVKNHILAGMLSKIFAESVLVDQEFIMSSENFTGSVMDFLKKNGVSDISYLKLLFVK